MGIQEKAARAVIDMEDPDCTPRRRKMIENWLAKDPRHREAYRIIKASNEYAARVLRLRKKLLHKAH